MANTEPYRNLEEPTASEQLAALLASPKRDIAALQILALHHQDALTPEERALLLDALMESAPAPEAEPEPEPAESKPFTASEQWAALDKARTYQDVLQPDLSKAWQQQQEQQQRVLQRQMELQKQMEDHQRRAATRNATLGPNAQQYTDVVSTIPGAFPKFW